MNNMFKGDFKNKNKIKNLLHPNKGGFGEYCRFEASERQYKHSTAVHEM